MQNTYRTLLSLYHKCLDNLRPGVSVKDVVEKAHRYLWDKSPDLDQYLTKVGVVFCFSAVFFCFYSKAGKGGRGGGGLLVLFGAFFIVLFFTVEPPRSVWRSVWGGNGSYSCFACPSRGEVIDHASHLGRTEWCQRKGGVCMCVCAFVCERDGRTKTDGVMKSGRISVYLMPQ